MIMKDAMYHSLWILETRFKTMWKLTATKPLKYGWDGKFYMFFFFTLIKNTKQNNIYEIIHLERHL